MSKIYVSTYQKYTTGTMKGEWLGRVIEAVFK